ncbi:MAG: tryptophan synthase subunit alpha [Deltaproteobacteria bacterium]|nr:tryptophan synthase subunit alpha [Deltaproteobacteria bacterium]
MTRTSRIRERFDELTARDERALVIYVTAGHPTMSRCPEVLHAVVEGGADLVELGIPFSDPMADGPTIQRSSSRALKAGATMEGAFSLVREFRRMCAIPLVLFTYYNPVFVYGGERFARRAEAEGADGVLVVDLPPEEAGELTPHLRARGLDFIQLVTPTTGPERIASIASSAGGFLYYVTVTGVTGARESMDREVGPALQRIRDVSPVPVCAGFGISSPDQVREVARFADGVVVGSALVNLVERSAESPELFREVRDFVAELKGATRNAGAITKNR